MIKSQRTPGNAVSWARTRRKNKETDPQTLPIPGVLDTGRINITPRLENETHFKHFPCSKPWVASHCEGLVFTVSSSGRVSSHAHTQLFTSSAPHSSPSPLRSAQKELGYSLSHSHGWTAVESSMSYYRMASFPQWTVGSCESKACLFFKKKSLWLN